MTTIACNREQMAADTRVVCGGDIYTSRQKIVRVGDMIAGAAGMDYYIQQFFELMRKGGEPKFELREQDAEADEIDFIGLVLTPEGIVFYDDTLTPQPIEGSSFAIGSGGQAARAAMLMGADPKTAVKVAAKVDSGTGLPVVSLRLKRKPGAVKRTKRLV